MQTTTSKRRCERRRQSKKIPFHSLPECRSRGGAVEGKDVTRHLQRDRRDGAEIGLLRDLGQTLPQILVLLKRLLQQMAESDALAVLEREVIAFQGLF